MQKRKEEEERKKQEEKLKKQEKESQIKEERAQFKLERDKEREAMKRDMLNRKKEKKGQGIQIELVIPEFMK